MIVDMLSKKKLNPILTELFIRGRKLNNFLVFITKSYLAVPKNIRLSSTQTNESLSKLHLIIHQILNLKTLCIFIKNVLQNHILF